MDKSINDSKAIISSILGMTIFLNVHQHKVGIQARIPQSLSLTLYCSILQVHFSYTQLSMFTTSSP